MFKPNWRYIIKTGKIIGNRNEHAQNEDKEMLEASPLQLAQMEEYRASPLQLTRKEESPL